MHDTLIFSIFVIFTGAALFATVALYTRQSLLVAYILLGVLLGPWGMGLLSDDKVVNEIGHVGIIFLLFLLGLHLQPQNLLHMLQKTVAVTLLSSFAFFTVGYVISFTFGFGYIESIIIGLTMMFSSTIIGLKLLPNSALHHQHIGGVMISILLLQDLVAILVLLGFNVLHGGYVEISDILILFLAFPGLLVIAFSAERFILRPLLNYFRQIREYLFLMSIGWCLGVAELASLIGLTHEIGAFLAGVAIAVSPIALYIADSLKPVRDFFLVLFFFSIGASFNFNILPSIATIAVTLAMVILVIKPLIFYLLLRRQGESTATAWEVGIRLGQGSEFSLFLMALALSSGFLSIEAANLIKAVTIITFIISSYWVVFQYKTPMALNEELHRE